MRKRGHMAACMSLKRWSKEWFTKLREERIDLVHHFLA
jgi:hypothetical protein